MIFHDVVIHSLEHHFFSHKLLIVLKGHIYRPDAENISQNSIISWKGTPKDHGKSEASPNHGIDIRQWFVSLWHQTHSTLATSSSIEVGPS